MSQLPGVVPSDLADLAAVLEELLALVVVDVVRKVAQEARDAACRLLRLLELLARAARLARGGPARTRLGELDLARAAHAVRARECDGGGGGVRRGK